MSYVIEIKLHDTKWSLKTCTHGVLWTKSRNKTEEYCRILHYMDTWIRPFAIFLPSVWQYSIADYFRWRHSDESFSGDCPVPIYLMMCCWKNERCRGKTCNRANHERRRLNAWDAIYRNSNSELVIHRGFVAGHSKLKTWRTILPH